MAISMTKPETGSVNWGSAANQNFTWLDAIINGPVVSNTPRRSSWLTITTSPNTKQITADFPCMLSIRQISGGTATVSVQGESGSVQLDQYYDGYASGHVNLPLASGDVVTITNSSASSMNFEILELPIVGVSSGTARDVSIDTTAATTTDLKYFRTINNVLFFFGAVYKSYNGIASYQIFSLTNNDGKTGGTVYALLHRNFNNGSNSTTSIIYSGTSRTLQQVLNNSGGAPIDALGPYGSGSPMHPMPMGSSIQLGTSAAGSARVWTIMYFVPEQF